MLVFWVFFLLKNYCFILLLFICYFNDSMVVMYFYYGDGWIGFYNRVFVCLLVVVYNYVVFFKVLWGKDEMIIDSMMG